MKQKKVIYQAWDAVFHLVKRVENTTRSGVFLMNFEVFHLVKTLSNAWYYFSNKMILEGQIQDAKMTSFSSDFHTLIKH